MIYILVGYMEHQGFSGFRLEGWVNSGRRVCRTSTKAQAIAEETLGF